MTENLFISGDLIFLQQIYYCIRKWRKHQGRDQEICPSLDTQCVRNLYFPICKCTSCFKVLLMLLLLLSCFSRVQLCATPEKAAHQAPLSLGFSRQEYWSKLPFEDFIFNKLYIISPELHRNFIFHPFCSHTHKKLSCSPELSCSAPLFSFTLRPNYCQ